MVKIWQAVVLCVLILFLPGRSHADPTEMYLNITVIDDVMGCVQTLKNLDEYAVTLLEGAPVTLIVTENAPKNHLHYISCANYENSKQVFQHSKDYDPINLKLSISKITKEMAGLWNCTVQGYRYFDNNLSVEPLHYSAGKKHHYAENYCIVKVHVREKESPHMLLVNRIRQKTTVNTDLHQSIDRTAIYSFVEGEEVEVLCLNRNEYCTDMEFKYDFAEQLDSHFKEMKGRIGAGMRTILRYQNSGTKLTCKCAHGKNPDIIQLTFQIKDNDDDFICKINNLVTRGHEYNKGQWGVKSQAVYYNTLKSEENNLHVACNIYNTIKEFDYSTMTPKINQTTNATSLEFILAKPEECTINVNIGTSFTDKIVINFESLIIADKSDVVELTMELNPKPVIDLFVLGSAYLMYYEYTEDGDNVTVTCKERHHPKLLIDMDFNGTRITADSSSTFIQLNSATDHSNFTCKVAQRNRFDDPKRDAYYRYSIVIFRQKEKTTTTTSTSTTSTTTPATYGTSTDPELTDVPSTESPVNQSIIIGAVVCVTGVVLVAVIVVMCKRRQNKPGGTGDLNYENLQCHSEASIPAHPPQWSRHQEEVNYQVPVDVRKEDAIYAQPVTEDPYATPIPKSLRPGKVKKQAYEPTYAELNLPSTGRMSQAQSERSDYATVGELYSQVLPKAARKNQNAYDNVFPESRYVNSGNTEYVEPTYCQPHNLK